MQGNTDYLPQNCSEQEFVSHHNDFALFSLRNMLIEIETNTATGFETHLAQFIYEKISDLESRIWLVGQANMERSWFHQTLNTLEFWTKFMYCRSTNQPKDSILIGNGFTRIDNMLDPKNQSLPVQSPQMTPVWDSEHLHNANDQTAYREIQISYLDNNWSSILGPQNLTNFYEAKAVNVESVYSEENEGNENDITEWVQVPQLNLTKAKKSDHRYDASQIYQPDDVDKSSRSNEQYSVLSGKSKEEIKEEIQCQVEQLMSKFWTQKELEDIQQENLNPNVHKNQKSEIASFAETLIHNINSKLSHKDSKDSRYNDKHKTQTINTKNILSEIDMGSKYLVQHEDKTDLYKLSSEGYEEQIKPKKLKLDKLNENEKINIIDYSDSQKEEHSNSILQDIKAITSKHTNKDENSHEFDFESVIDGDRDEEIKGHAELRFSLHEVDKSNCEKPKKKKGKQNEKQNKKQKKDKKKKQKDKAPIEIEDIKLSEEPEEDKMDPNVAVKKGIKLINRSLKKTEKCMQTFFALLLFDEKSERNSRSRSKTSNKKKRSNSLFACFGSSWGANKNIIRKDSSLKLSKSRSIDITNEPPTEMVKTKTKEKRCKKESAKTVRDKKNKSKKKNIIEVAENSDRIPIIKTRSKNETFDLSNKNLKSINLNSTYEGPKIFKKTRNKKLDQGNKTDLKMTLEHNSLEKLNESVKIDSKGCIKSKFSPRGSINSDTRLETMKSIKFHTLNEGKNKSKIGIKQYIKHKSGSEIKESEGSEPKIHSSRMKTSKLLINSKSGKSNEE